MSFTRTLLCLASVLSLGSIAHAQETLLAPARLWAGGFAAEPRLPFVGDADGDGRADMFALYPPGDAIIDLMRTSAMGKPRWPVQARTKAGKDLRVGICGRFHNPDSTDVMLIAKDGVIRVLSQLGADGRYAKMETWPAPPQLPEPVAYAVTLPSAKGCDSVLLADKKGNLLLLRHLPTTDGSLGFEASILKARFPNIRQLAANHTGDTLYWVNDSGTVYRSHLTDEITETKQILRIAPHAKLTVGRFRGVDTSDVLAGTRLLPGGDSDRAITLTNLPTDKEAQGDLAWFAADMDGDGRDDLVRVRRSGERFVGDDVLVHFSQKDGDRSDLASSSGDGLLDAWKSGRIKPGGLDLPALGCKVGQYDVIVEVQRLEAVSDELVHTEMERVVQYFAKLPVTSPNGTKGIALHVIYREPMPTAGPSWMADGEKYHPASHRGVTHWMGVYSGGGGQSDEMADRGSTGSQALYATFIHEFGHQLGLDHTGFQSPAWCPIYPSLMNYAYSYQLNGNRDDIGYSDGRLASVTLNESHLSETLPLPPDKVSFLAGPPYRYRMKPTPDGKGTLIDWNWNGVFGEKSVSADINYGYSTTGGLRHTIGKTYTSPVLTTLKSGKKENLLLFSGLLPEGIPFPPLDTPTAKCSLSSETPGRLMVRLWQGENAAVDGPKWSEEIPIATEGVTGEVSAVSLGETTWIAYPTIAGVVVRPLTLEPGKTLQIGVGALIPGTVGAQATLTTLNDRLVLLLWRDEKTPVGLSALLVEGTAVKAEPEASLKFTSRMPVGAVAGGKDKLWIGLMQDRDAQRTFCGQVRQFTLHSDGTLEQTLQEWVGDENRGQRGQSRPVLLWKEDKSFKDRGGQLWFVATGLLHKDNPIACSYISTRIADMSVNAGWLQRRYYDEWTQSRSGPGACFFKGEMIFASRWFGNVHGTENDNLFVAFYGRGFESEPMSDFDDISFIRDIGMSHSILYRAE